eukprot:UN12454
MATKAYFAEIPERPTEVLELRPFNDGTHRGAKIIDLNEDISQEGWAQLIHCPARIISIAGERITGYTFKSIHKKLSRCSLPIRLRLESILSSHSHSHSHSHSNQSSDSESDADNYNRKRRNKFSSIYNKQRITNYTQTQKYKHSSHYSNGNKKTPKIPKLNKTDSNESAYSTISINLQSSTAKECSVKSCTKILKERKQHRCRRCASVVW